MDGQISAGSDVSVFLKKSENVIVCKIFQSILALFNEKTCFCYNNLSSMECYFYFLVPIFIQNTCLTSQFPDLVFRYSILLISRSYVHSRYLFNLPVPRLSFQIQYSLKKMLEYDETGRLGCFILGSLFFFKLKLLI